MVEYYLKGDDTLKRIIYILQILQILYCIQCLKAERSPFDFSNRSNPATSFIMATASSGRISQSAIANSGLSFQYAQSSYTGYTGISLSISSPTIKSGTISSYSISPNLPVGLTLDVNSGAISGTPSGSATNQQYTVTGTYGNDSSTSSFTLKIGSSTASSVYGQTNFTLSGGSAGTNGLNGPYDLMFDSTGKLYVADTTNNRVVSYASGSSSASQVYGQLGSFASTSVNNGGISANSLSSPRGLTLDTNGNLYISDYSNNRVLFYTSGSTTASRVYGQLGAYTTLTMNNGGVTADSMAGPYRPAIDSNDNLYVPNVFSHRVLVYASGSTTAMRVYGQLGSFTTNTANNGGVSADSLNAPVAVALDSSGNVYIADRQNNRVLYYTAGSTTASRVYGQLGSFTTNIANNGGTSADSLNAPTGLALDASGNLYIADSVNNRVLFYPAGSTTATRVYGQLGSFTSNTANNGGITANSLNTPFSITLDRDNKLYIADNGNNRIVVFYVP